MMPLAFSFHAFVIALGPSASNDPLSGPLHQALPHENGCLPSPMGPELAAALFPHRRQTGVFLETGGIGMARTSVLTIGTGGRFWHWVARGAQTAHAVPGGRYTT